MSVAPSAITVYVTQGVTANAANFTLTKTTGSGTTNVPFAYSFNAGASAMTITPTAALDAGDYTLTATGVVASSGGLGLDGEVANAADPVSLPSGNGTAGGSSLKFTITAPSCPPDFNNDGFLDFTDFDAFVAGFEAGDTASDFNNDGFIDFTDFDAYVAAFEAGC